jgi:phospholipid-binding lipoprotein MlaA
MRRLARACPCLLALWLLAACAGTPQLPPEIAVQPELAAAARTPSVIDVYDPLEPLNRAIYDFNARFDRYLFLPVVRAYEFVTPDFVENRVSDFFDNIADIPNFVNAVLQLKPETAGRAATRLIVNTMFTAGLFDLAGARGVEQVTEDLGQTLGRWGVGNGPFLVLPLFGPSNLRDATGRLGDTLLISWLTPEPIADHPAYIATRFVLQPIDARSRIAFRYYQTGTPFEYDLVRLLYTEVRQLQIAN